jgi:polyether ionophore transport system permease protein
VRAGRAVAGRAFADSRVRTLSFALFFGLLAYVQPVAYRHSYPTLHERLDFAHGFGANKAVRLFYGVPHDLLTSGGYAAWRVGGLLAIFAAMWGLLAAVRALRGEEDAGRQELVLAGLVTRGGAFGAALAAIGAGATILWLALFVGLVAASLPVGDSAFLALATVSPVPVFVGIGALASQLAQTRRLAIEISSAALAVAFAVRVIADTSSGLDWLRWATPLGWAEELRPFAGPRPLVLLLPAATSVLPLAAAGLLAVGRDVGIGLLRAPDSAEPRFRLLSSPTGQALRGERGSLAGWLLGVGAFAFIVGVISKSVSTVTVSESLRRELEKLGGASITTASGYIGFTFLFFVLAVSLFVCSQMAAARHEEAGQELETLLALPFGRRSWLGGRLLLAAAGATVIALAAGVLAWAGAAWQGAGVSFPDMVGAGANCLPAALLFLSLGALAFSAAPRASAGIAYGLVSVAFVWELFGALLGAPEWTLALSPFHHVGLVPAQPFKATAAVVMLAIAALAALAALAVFRRRDLAGA